MAIRVPSKRTRTVKVTSSLTEMNRWAIKLDEKEDEIIDTLQSMAITLNKLTNYTSPAASGSLTPHAPTHLPNGSDPINTAVANTILPDDVPAVGTANALSRSDHRHGIATGTPVGFGVAHAEGSGSDFSRADHIHKYTDRLFDPVNSQTVIITDTGAVTRLAFSRSTVEFTGIDVALTLSSASGGLIINGSGTALSAPSGLIRAPNFNLLGGILAGVGSDWNPTPSATYSLGIPTRKWLNGEFSGTVTAGTFSGTFTLGAGNFAAPAFTLGTTNVDGVATTAVRSDSSIAIFDATVPADLASAAATGAAAFAARRDHVHKFPTTLRTAASGLELVATDSLGSITLTAPGSIRLVAGGAGNIQLVDNTAITGTLGTTQQTSLATSAGDVIIGRASGGNCIPNTTNQSQCGTTSKQWSDMNSVLCHLSGDLTMGAGTTILADAVTGNSIATVAGSFDTLNVTTDLSILDYASTIYNLHIRSADGSLGTDRNLDFVVNNADRTITMSGNPTLADWFDQSVKTTASPTHAGLTISDGGNIALGTTTGTKIGTATTQKIGLWNATPVTQRSDIGALTDNTTGTADGTVADVGAAFNQATLNNNFADLIDKINKLRTMMRDVGISA